MEERSNATAHRILILNMLAFAITFSAWMINGVLVTFLVNNGVFKWSPVQVGWLLGIPVLVGALLRLPVGLLTDRFGGRAVTTVVILLSALPTYGLSFANNYTQFLISSFLLGVAGSTFSAGVAYSSLWYSKEKQGTALGIYGAGTMGASLTTLFAPSMLRSFTENGAHLDQWRQLPKVFAIALIIYGVLFFFGTVSKKTSEVKSLAQRFAPLRQVRVWRFGLYYFFTFGSFVALSQWLIPYYVNVYSMTIVSAGFMASAFSLPAGLVRAAGGWLSDRFGARSVLLWVLSVCIITLFFLFFPRMEIKAPGQGLMANRPGQVVEVTATEIVVDDQRYQIMSRESHQDEVTIRFGVHNQGDQEGFLLLPSVLSWQEAEVQVGQRVEKGQLLAKGITLIYFQANVWIFFVLVFIVGVHMGIGNAAVYKHIAEYYPKDIGTVGGIVGVLGGLGGFVSPILFGYLLKMTGVWTTCWMLLALIALICYVLRRLAIQNIKDAEMDKLRTGAAIL